MPKFVSLWAPTISGMRVTHPFELGLLSFIQEFLFSFPTDIAIPIEFDFFFAVRLILLLSYSVFYKIERNQTL